MDWRENKIEDVVGMFLANKVAPKSKEISFDVFKSETGSPINPVKEERKQGIDFKSIINQSRTESKPGDRDNKSFNISIATSKPPMINMEDNKKNDDSGLFTFISNKGIDNMKVESVYALKEIIDIQESFIKKKSVNIASDLLKNWRIKVFELLFDNKRNELLFNEKIKRLQKDKREMLDELDHTNYKQSVTQQELSSVKYELQQKSNELDFLRKSLDEKESAHYDVNNKISEYEKTKSQIKKMIQDHLQNFSEQQQKINDSLFALQSYHKRLQILQKRIKTFAQLCKSEQNSYLEKYMQIKKDMKTVKIKDELNDELKIQINNLKRALEGKDVEISTIEHKYKLENDSKLKIELSKNSELDRSLSNALQKLKDVESLNLAVKSDNDRLLFRIKELEQDNIRLKTDLATQEALKRADYENMSYKYESLIKVKDQTIQSQQSKIEEIQYSTDKVTKKFSQLEQQVNEAEEGCKLKINSLVAQNDRCIKEKDTEILKLKEEIKDANEKIFRNNKFKQTIFSIEDAGNPINESMEIRSVGSIKIIQPQETYNFSRFDEQIPQIKGGTKEEPIELRPVGISPANSEYNSDRINTSNKYPNFMGEMSKSQANPFDVNKVPSLNPMNNPYYMGGFHPGSLIIPQRTNFTNVSTSQAEPKLTSSQEFDTSPKLVKLSQSHSDNFSFKPSQNYMNYQG